jgi:UDP:flavonoid glycosyltransferase YjiC (YdhE family)
MFSPVLASAQADWPKQTRISGFCFWEEPGDVKVPPSLVEFLEAGPPPVVFTLGSSAVLSPGEFYNESRTAVRELGVRAVMLDGRSESATQLNGKILCLSYAPHPYLFERAGAIVHSGGIGTCASAMRAGRPMLVVPFAYDQPDNAARLVRLGIARSIGRNKYTARLAASEIGTLLADSRYRANAERVARVIGTERGTANACDALESCLSGCR